MKNYILSRISSLIFLLLMPSFLYANPFILACKNGDLDSVRQNVWSTGRSRISIDKIATIKGYKKPLSGLMAACDNDHKEVVSCLLSAGAKLDLKDREGKTALHYAACSGHIDIINLLINEDANINARANNGYTPLLYAIHHEQFSAAKKIIASGADVYLKTDDEVSCLHMAAKKGNLELVEMLLQDGFKPNIASITGQTPLHTAVENNQPKIVQCLLETQRCDIDFQGRRGISPLMLAVFQGDKAKEIVDLLLSKGACLTLKSRSTGNPAIIAASNGFLENTKCLLESITDKNTKREIINSALFLAAANGRADVVDYLIMEGAVVNPVYPILLDGHHWTPLQHAVSNGHLEVTNILLSHNASLGHNFEHDRDSNKDRPLLLAIAGGHTEIVECLLKRNIVCDWMPDINIIIPTHAAMELAEKDEAKAREILSLLIEYGANVNRKNPRGETLLHVAARLNYSKIIELLLEKNADPGIHMQGAFTNRVTPIFSAIMRRNSEAVKALSSREEASRRLGCFSRGLMTIHKSIATRRERQKAAAVTRTPTYQQHQQYVMQSTAL